ncbi:hypothetical protein BJF86_15900 [Serinicoccus sp. CNJ-927]|nr:hypothetical protein BJF86_15900 [Serinicoccus sp. CNJ-927]
MTSMRSATRQVPWSRQLCSTTPTRARQASGAVVGAWSSTVTSPDEGCRKPSRISTVVVLPAPLGPSSATTCPRWISRSMPSRTRCSPYDIDRPRQLITGAGGMMAM